MFGKMKKGLLAAAAVLGIPFFFSAISPQEAQAASHSTNYVPANGKVYYFKNSLSGGSADVSFPYGSASDEVYVGDWNGDGKETLCIRRGKEFHFRNSLSAGGADIVVAYGVATDEVLVGDWDGDGKDTICLKRGSTYYFKNSLSGGEADAAYTFGSSYGTALVGDWNGDGKESVCSKYKNQYTFLMDAAKGGKITVAYGRETDTPLVGDWNGDGVDTLCVKRGKVYYFKNSLSEGGADLTCAYGKATDVAYAGDWNGDGKDSIMARRGNKYYFKYTAAGGSADKTATYSRAYDGLLVGDWDGDGSDTICARRTSGSGLVINSGAYSFNVDICNNQLSMLPQWMLDQFVASGWTIRVQPGDIGDIYLGMPDTSTTYTMGVTMYQDKKVVVLDSGYAVVESTIHEIGHWCDHMASDGSTRFYSNSQAFQAVYNAEYANFVKYCTRSDFFQTATYEVCAEAFECYFRNPDTLKKYCPGLYGWIETSIARLY